MSDSIQPVTGVNGNSGVPAIPAIPNVASTAPVGDTVTLSDSAKASLLQQEGQSVEQIAATLGLPISEVMRDLSVITAPSSLTFHP